MLTNEDVKTVLRAEITVLSERIQLLVLEVSVLEQRLEDSSLSTVQRVRLEGQRVVLSEAANLMILAVIDLKATVDSL